MPSCILLFVWLGSHAHTYAAKKSFLLSNCCVDLCIYVCMIDLQAISNYSADTFCGYSLLSWWPQLPRRLWIPASPPRWKRRHKLFTKSAQTRCSYLLLWLPHPLQIAAAAVVLVVLLLLKNRWSLAREQAHLWCARRPWNVSPQPQRKMQMWISLSLGVWNCWLSRSYQYFAITNIPLWDSTECFLPHMSFENHYYHYCYYYHYHHNEYGPATITPTTTSTMQRILSRA